MQIGCWGRGSVGWMETRFDASSLLGQGVCGVGGDNVSCKWVDWSREAHIMSDVMCCAVLCWAGDMGPKSLELPHGCLLQNFIWQSLSCLQVLSCIVVFHFFHAEANRWARTSRPWLLLISL